MRRRAGFTVIEVVLASLLLAVVLAFSWRAFLAGNRATSGSERLADFVQAEAVVRTQLEADLGCLAEVPGQPPAAVTPESLSFRRSSFSTGPRPIDIEDVSYECARERDGTYSLRRDGKLVLASGIVRPPFAIEELPGAVVIKAEFELAGTQGTGSGAGHFFRVAHILAREFVPPHPGPPPPPHGPAE